MHAYHRITSALILIGWAHSHVQIVAITLISNHTFYIVLYLHVFPGSLTLREVRAALRSVRGRWLNLGLVLGLLLETLQVIEGHAVSQHSLWFHEQLVTVTLFTIYTIHRVLQYGINIIIRIFRALYTCIRIFRYQCFYNLCNTLCTL